ncbi:MAG: hypothetical protein LBI44_04655 [Oscillospiraceae bacterium]|jgi:hypothetical protein|nr:hypothetical protein [Oscillospiraceae bacterium]
MDNPGDRSVRAARAVRMGPARVAVDLSCGSERGEYVCQDYILRALGRPHRAVNLMYCYYPLDEGWPARASALPVPGGREAGFAWDYAYDDYFPYGGGIEGDTSGEPFGQMRDIRRHGQDVILTLTVDCAVSNKQLERIADDLRPFGRMFLRINHEATGTWFAFNKRYTYRRVADFFVRFHSIIKRRAPHVRTILCIGDDRPDAQGKMPYEDDFAQAIAAADIWSADTYLALHWGWPFDIAEPGGKTHKRVTNDSVLRGFLFEHTRFMARSGGKDRPFYISEFNADGDVTGPFEQASQLADLYRRLPLEAPCVKAVTMYQFRDRGRLGLEIEDPNCPHVGIAQPLLAEYKEIINSSPYLPVFTPGGAAEYPVPLRWGGSEDADGAEFTVVMEQIPVFCEVCFPQDISLNLMIEFCGAWFYKKPGVLSVDLMPAFFAQTPPQTRSRELPLRLFAPPPCGVNLPEQGEGWETDYRAALTAPPELRIRYSPVMP